jgi:hypothetical protein
MHVKAWRSLRKIFGAAWLSAAWLSEMLCTSEGAAVARANTALFELPCGALVTSESSGCVLGASGALFERNGRSAAHWKLITVHKCQQWPMPRRRLSQLHPAKSRHCQRALRERWCAPRTIANANGNGFRRRTPALGQEHGPQNFALTRFFTRTGAYFAQERSRYLFLPSASYCLMKAQRLFASASFLIPANAILVFGILALGSLT